jgi:hypothetical protein
MITINTMDINSFIKDNYTVVYKGEGVEESDFSTANEYLLADHHGSNGHSALNSLFINTFAESQDVVMVEAIASMTEIAPNDALQSVWLNTKAKIIGWDIGKVGEIMESALFQESGDLEIRNQILIRRLLDPEFEGNKEEVKQEIVKIMIKAREIFFRMKDGVLEQENFLGLIAKTLPARTKSMTTSMDRAREVYNRTFLIAGQNHLKNDYENSPLSLEKFYEFLKTRKVVMLFPKDKAIVEKGKERDLKMMEIFLSARSL